MHTQTNHHRANNNLFIVVMLILLIIGGLLVQFGPQFATNMTVVEDTAAADAAAQPDDQGSANTSAENSLVNGNVATTHAGSEGNHLVPGFAREP
ncbi:MAG: hypothetical protein IPM16_14070 [Chloroflexi bacterium]|nr:hypothetical protein [Chloroflexota bacterium]